LRAKLLKFLCVPAPKFCLKRLKTFGDQEEKSYWGGPTFTWRSPPQSPKIYLSPTFRRSKFEVGGSPAAIEIVYKADPKSTKDRFVFCGICLLLLIKKARGCLTLKSAIQFKLRSRSPVSRSRTKKINRNKQVQDQSKRRSRQNDPTWPFVPGVGVGHVRWKSKKGRLGRTSRGRT
jgi:hypothetical protein